MDAGQWSREALEKNRAEQNAELIEVDVVLAGAAVVLPFIVGYTFYVYRIFGGKTKDGAY